MGIVKKVRTVKGVKDVARAVIVDSVRKVKSVKNVTDLRAVARTERGK